MSFKIPNGLVYEAADIGLDGITVNFGAIVNAVPVLPWGVLGTIRSIHLVSDQGGSGATPYDIFIRPHDFQGAAFAVTTNSGLWAAIGNNPRVQYYTASLGSLTASGSTGGTIPSEVARALAAPFMQFAVRNNHGGINMTNYQLRYAILKF